MPVAMAAWAALVSCASEPRAGPGEPEVPVVSSVVITGAPGEVHSLYRPFTLAASARDQNGVVIPGVSITWTSLNSFVARVNDGVVMPVRNGTAQITASSGAVVSAPVTLTIRQIPARWTVAATQLRLGRIGATAFIGTAIYDSANASMSDSVRTIWTVAGTGATIQVEDFGQVRSVGYGDEDTLVGSYVNGTVSFSTRVPVAVARIPASVVIYPPPGPGDTLRAIGRTLALSAAVFDETGDAIIPPVVTWSSEEPNLATVTSSGLVTAASSAGLASILATAGPAVGRRGVIVERTLLGFTISPRSAAVDEYHETLTFSAFAEDSGGTTVPLFWLSSDHSVLGLIGSGPLATAYARKDGTAWVGIAEAWLGRRDSVLVTVSGQSVPKFRVAIQPMLTASCATSGCHIGPAPTGALDLSDGAAWAQLVNVPAVAAPGLLRVRPGQPDSSYLVHRVNGSSPPLMPPSGPQLTAAEIQRIRNWIAAGAPNN